MNTVAELQHRHAGWTGGWWKRRRERSRRGCRQVVESLLRSCGEAWKSWEVGPPTGPTSRYCAGYGSINQSAPYSWTFAWPKGPRGTWLLTWKHPPEAKSFNQNSMVRQNPPHSNNPGPHPLGEHHDSTRTCRPKSHDSGNQSRPSGVVLWPGGSHLLETHMETVPTTTKYFNRIVYE